MATPESRAPLATLAAPAYPDHLVGPAPLDLKDLRVNLVLKVALAQWVSLVLWVQQESVVCLVCPGHLDLLASEEKLELP